MLKMKAFHPNQITISKIVVPAKKIRKKDQDILISILKVLAN